MAGKCDMTVNRRLLPTKSTYFFVLAAVASLLPYLPVFMKQLGLSASEIAILYGLMPFLGFLIRPVIGLISDKFQKHTAVLMLCMVLTGILAFPMLFLQPRSRSNQQITTVVEQASLMCSQEQTSVKLCASISSSPCNRQDIDMTSEQTRNVSGHCDLECSKTHGNKICLSSMNNLSSNKTCISDENFAVTIKISNLNWKILINNGPNMTGINTSVCHTHQVSSLIYQGEIFPSLVCASPMTLHCDASCNFTKFENLYQECEDNSQEHQRYDLTFWLFFVFYLLSQLSFAPIFGLIDAIAYGFLGEERDKWGKQRLWGTLGFASFGFISGFIMDSYSSKHMNYDYIYPFAGYIVHMVIASLCVCQMKVTNQIQGQSLLKNMGKLLKRVEVSAFLFIVLIFGMNTGTLEAFLYWHLGNLGATKTVFGLCMVVNCTAEVIMLFFADKIIKKIGHLNCLFLAFLAYAVRFTSVTFIENAWLVLPIELSHGLTFSLMYAGASGYGSYLTPAGLSGTIQGLISGLHFGIGKGIGSLLSGQLIEVYGGVTTFRIFAVANVIIFMVYVIIHYLFLRKRIAAFEEKRKAQDKSGENLELEEEKMLTHDGDSKTNGAIREPHLAPDLKTGDGGQIKL